MRAVVEASEGRKVGQKEQEKEWPKQEEYAASGSETVQTKSQRKGAEGTKNDPLNGSVKCV